MFFLCFPKRKNIYYLDMDMKRQGVQGRGEEKAKGKIGHAGTSPPLELPFTPWKYGDMSASWKVHKKKLWVNSQGEERRCVHVCVYVYACMYVCTRIYTRTYARVRVCEVRGLDCQKVKNPHCGQVKLSKGRILKNWKELPKSENQLSKSENHHF